MGILLLSESYLREKIMKKINESGHSVPRWNAAYGLINVREFYGNALPDNALV